MALIRSRRFTRRTRAILPVHVFGYPADMPAVRTIARGHSLVVVEDACEALGTSARAAWAVCIIDFTTFKSTPIPEDLRERMQAFLHSPS
jgi:dTDP-4-amino-4,6-dideoxygalactose transaminase